VSAYRVISLEPPARAQTLAFVGLDEEGSTRTGGFDRWPGSRAEMRARVAAAAPERTDG
jgi:hypothetical protein